MGLSMLYFAMSQIGLAIAWGNQRSPLWMLAAPFAAFLASMVLWQWAPLMPMWGEAASIVQGGGLFVGALTLGGQLVLGDGAAF